MVRKNKINILIIAGALFSISTFAETVILNSGEIIEADSVEIISDSRKVRLTEAVATYRLDQVKSINGKKIKEKIAENVNSNEEGRAVEKVKGLLKEKRGELEAKRKEYIEAKKRLKKAARTGFFGFGRTKEEVDSLIRAKEKVVEIKQEYGNIKKKINQLRQNLKKAIR